LSIFRLQDGLGELGSVIAASRYSSVIDASDWSTNLSVFLNFAFELINPTKSNLNELPDNTDRHTVAFYFTDGDNIQYLSGGITDNLHWANKNRTLVNKAWGLNPTLADIAPIIPFYWYSTASKVNDSFVSWSAGYAYPNEMNSQQTARWAAATSTSMKAMDLSIVTYLVSNDIYSNNGYNDLLAYDNIKGAIFMPYDQWYTAENGTIHWSCAKNITNSKPVISPRQSLWKPQQSPQSIAKLLNSQSIQHNSGEAYSLIMIHMWSIDINDVIETVQLLDSKKVLLVKPDQLLQLIQNNVKPQPIC
jgi:hypothetical protein